MRANSNNYFSENAIFSPRPIAVAAALWPLIWSKATERMNGTTSAPSTVRVIAKFDFEGRNNDEVGIS